MYNKSIYATLFPYLQQRQPVAQSGASMPQDDPQIQTLGENQPQAQPQNGMSQPLGYDSPQAQVNPNSQGGGPMTVDPMQFPNSWAGDDGVIPQRPIDSQRFTPEPIDESVSQGYAGVGGNTPNPVRDFPSTMERPQPVQPETGKAKRQMPEGLSELEQAEWTAQYGENQDKGFKGTLKEIISNFLFGMGQSGPNTDWKAALALGGIGAAGGAIDRGWNERRQAQSQIPILRDREQYQLGNRAKQAQIANAEAQPGLKQGELERKIKRDQITEEYNNNRIKLGKEKADDVKWLQERRLDLVERGLDQKDEQIQQIDKKIEETIRSNKAKETMAGQKLSLDEKTKMLKIKSEPILIQLRDKKLSPALRSKLEADLHHLQDEFDNDDD